MDSTRRAFAMMVAAMAIAGCAGPQSPPPATPAAEAANAPVVRRPLDVQPTPPQPLPSQPAPGSEPPEAPLAAAPNALYVCVSDHAGRRTQTAIEFAPKVLSLCRRHPEMGPCQYERDLCRKSGGRVFAADGREITRQVEDEYDRKVMRVRFRAN